MDVLVIGGSGFVGAAVVRACLAAGGSVAVLNRGNKKIAGAKQLIADRNDASAVMAAIGHHHFRAVIDTNCYTGLQARIITAALQNRVSCAAVISSSAVYVGDRPAPWPEDAPVGGGVVWGDYGRDKSDVERVYADRATRLGRVAVFRPPYIFGPNNNLDREGWFFRRLTHNRPILLPGQGLARVQFVHEDDLGRAIVAWTLERYADERNFCAYNLADPQILTLAELTLLLGEAVGVAANPVFLCGANGAIPARQWFPFRDADCAVDPSAFMRATGWTSGAPLLDLFRSTFRELKATGVLVTDDWSELEGRLSAKMHAIGSTSK